MRMYILLVLSFFGRGVSYAQVGINTTSPQASLHINESSPTVPKGTDGVLVPIISDFPVISPVEDGNLVHLRKVNGVSATTEPDGFYYWKRGQWILITTGVAETYIYRNVYCMYGQGYENESNTPTGEYRKILFTNLIYNMSEVRPTEEFSISNNEMTIGRTGLYMASLVTGARKDGENLSTQQNSNITGEILVNGNPYNVSAPSGVSILTAKASGSSSVESITASQLTLNVLLQLNKGDKVSARVRQDDVREGNGSLSAIQAKYANTEISTLTLKFIYNL